jgi:hypothetical protein
MSTVPIASSAQALATPLYDVEANQGWQYVRRMLPDGREIWETDAPKPIFSIRRKGMSCPGVWNPGDRRRKPRHVPQRRRVLASKQKQNYCTGRRNCSACVAQASEEHV